MKNAFVFVGLALVLILLSGCVDESGAINYVKTLPEVQAFLDENPDAQMRAVFINRQNAKIMIGDIREACGEQMEEHAYWHVYMTKGGKEMQVYFDDARQQDPCIVKPGEPPPTQTQEPGEEPQEPEGPDAEEPGPQDECSRDSDCDDNDSCTEDSCSGTPKKCSSTQITDCDDGDDCCPNDCTSENDDDCPEEEECKTHEDCADGNNATRDICSGTPKKCSNVLKTCDQMYGEICDEEIQYCPDSFVLSADTNKCCAVKCSSITICTGVVCPSNQKCVGGNCVPKDCGEQNGNICSIDQDCSGSWITANDTEYCCSGTCITS